MSGFFGLASRTMPFLSRRIWYRKLFEPLALGQYTRKPFQATIIPLNAKVKASPGSVVPYQLIDGIIDKAGFRLLLRECMCRKGMGCERYPHDLACLFLGEGARSLMGGESPPGREVSAEEAKEHVRKAGELGLVPLASYVPFEQVLFGVPHHLNDQLLEFCFCCPCCCIALHNMKYFTRRTQKSYRNVGFVAKALPTCRGCLDCVSVCPADAIRVKGDKVWVKEDDCIGCGLCQNACSHNAIRLVQVAPIREGLLDYFEGIEIDIR